jgi:predicted Na+-dependent transporter
MRKQTRLLLNVGYWFLLPIFLVMVISSILLQHGRTGSDHPRAVLWALYAAYAVIAVLAILLCRREANRRFIPLMARLKELRRDLVG